MWDRQNGNILRAGYLFAAQSVNPITLGDVGWWFDGTTLYFVSANGNKTAAGSASNSWKTACRLASNAALSAGSYSTTTLAFTKTTAGKLTVDSVDAAVGDRILIKNQADATQNGIYVCTVAGSVSVSFVITRAPDCNTSSQFLPAHLVAISEGTVNQDSIYEFSSDAPFTIDVSNATYTAAPLSITYAVAGDMAANGLVATNSAGSSNTAARGDHAHAWGTDLVAVKEVDHVVYPAASTTAATAGAAMTIRGAVSKTSGAGGAANLIGGAGDTTGAGGAANHTGGAGGSVSGTGGAATVTGGAGTAGNANGGSVTILGGAKQGSGTNGTIAIGTSNTSAITIGATSIISTFNGPIAAAAAAWLIADPGDAGAIPVTRSGVCAITTAGSETRTVAIPTFVGQMLSLIIDVDGGTAVVTFASAINQAGNTIATMADVKDMLHLVGMQVAGTRVWRVVANDGAALS